MSLGGPFPTTTPRHTSAPCCMPTNFTVMQCHIARRGAGLMAALLASRMQLHVCCPIRTTGKMQPHCRPDRNSGNIPASCRLCVCCTTGPQAAGEGVAGYIVISHGPQGKGFPWQSVPRYPVSAPPPQICPHFVQLSEGTLSFQGSVTAFESPVLLEGDALDFVVDTLLGAPREPADFELTCTSLQPYPRNASSASSVAKRMDPMSVPARLPTEASASKYNRPRHLGWDTENEDDSDGSSSYEEYPSYSGDADNSDSQDLHGSQELKNPGSSYGRRHEYPRPPASPPTDPEGILTSSFTSEFLLLLVPSDVNATGHLTQNDFKVWGKATVRF